MKEQFAQMLAALSLDMATSRGSFVLFGETEMPEEMKKEIEEMQNN